MGGFMENYRYISQEDRERSITLRLSNLQRLWIL